MFKDSTHTEQFTESNITAGTTLYGTQGITVTFDPSGGTVSPTTKAVTQNSTYGELQTPERAGYIFTGWFNSEGTAVNSTTVVTTANDHTLTAGWEANKYTVTFNATGGIVLLSSKTVTFDELYRDLPNAIKPGNVFLWWFLISSDGSENKTVINSETKVATPENHTLYAVV